MKYTQGGLSMLCPRVCLSKPAKQDPLWLVNPGSGHLAAFILFFIISHLTWHSLKIQQCMCMLQEKQKAERKRLNQTKGKEQGYIKQSNI